MAGVRKQEQLGVAGARSARRRVAGCGRARWDKGLPCILRETGGSWGFTQKVTYSESPFTKLKLAVVWKWTGRAESAEGRGPHGSCGSNFS